ncbi:hypothetical protein FACS1894159_06320 [Bacteroidia bacterium]|nr:hypothetical protein FACS1894159_06320 [Bacteroidia bacterium]
MNPLKTLVFCSILPGAIPAAKAAQAVAERPNILWLTFEDSSWYLFGCYGNRSVHTPNIDSLARGGIQYMNGWSNGPQSSPARSTLITGCYATTYGMDVHPVAYPTPAGIFFPEFLRAAGYYCTNNSKTHYNTTQNHKTIWNECAADASYNSARRPAGAPFFSVFNTVTSHMSRVRTFHTASRRDYSKEGIVIDSLLLPPHVPHLPEVCSDYAAHLEAIQDVDTWVGFFLKDLREKGLADNTIIFVFSDHGGVLPRGKGYLHETGLRVPLVAWFPPRWAHLAGGPAGRKDSTLVSFVDLGPTMLSLAGIEPPRYMQGRAVLGKYKALKPNEYLFGLAANQLHHFMPTRAVTDGRWKYIRSFIPYKEYALRNYFQWGMPSNQAWDDLAMGVRAEESVAPWSWAGEERLMRPYRYGSGEMLFDLSKDPFETVDLSGDHACATVLERLRGVLADHIGTSGDVGFFIPTCRENVSLWDRVHKDKYPLAELQALASLPGRATAADLAKAERYLSSKDPSMRFWAVVAHGQALLSGTVERLPAGFERLADDPDRYVAAEACFALAYAGKPEEAVGKLLSGDAATIKVGYSLLEALSLDAAMQPHILPFADKLRDHARTLPARENEDAGYMARGVLANLGLMLVRDIYGPEAWEAGLKLNRGRRPMLPLP